MKRFLRYFVGLLALCLAVSQAQVIRDGSPSVSLRFSESFGMEEAWFFGAAWGQEAVLISGIEATQITFTGDAQLVLPARWVHGVPPGELGEQVCAVSTGLAYALFGGADVVGMQLGGDRICGVFDWDSPVVLKPGTGGFTGAELFPFPQNEDPYRYGLDSAARAGLPEPEQLLCGPEAGGIAWMLILLPVLWVLTGPLGRWRWLLTAVVLAAALPGWCFPTRLSDTVFWAELWQSICGRIGSRMTLSPALRDPAAGYAWLRLGIALICAKWCFSERHGKMGHKK